MNEKQKEDIDKMSKKELSNFIMVLSSDSPCYDYTVKRLRGWLNETSRYNQTEDQNAKRSTPRFTQRSKKQEIYIRKSNWWTWMGVKMKSRIFTTAELKALNRRLKGDKTDPTGIYSGRVKPKLKELIEWLKRKEIKKLID